MRSSRKFLFGSLYFKIFVWYWIAMAIVGALVLIMVALTQPENNAKEQRARLEEVIDISGTTAAEDFARKGPRAVMTYFNRVRRSKRRQHDGTLKLWLFSAKGRELNGQELPSRVRALVRTMVAQRNGSSGTPNSEIQWSQASDSMTGARWAEDGNGKFFILTADLSTNAPRDPWTRVVRIMRAPWPTQILRSVTVLLATGIICFLLARHLTSPIGQLQSTARRLASGNLEARMGPTLGNRRDEIATLARDFDYMAEQVQSLLQSQSRLLGDISHELRSPLARLNVAHDLALHHAATGKYEDLDADLQRIGSETQRLDSLIEQLLSLSRLESGAAHQKQETINLNNLLHELVADADFEARSRSKSVEIAHSDDCEIIGNESLLRSAIENILRNAVRYTPEKSAVSLSLLRPSPQAVIMIRDHGPGVPEEELKNLFRPFYRLSNTPHQSGSAGLGLAITQRAIEAHQGSVVARNISGGGLEVEVRLPIKS